MKQVFLGWLLAASFAFAAEQKVIIAVEGMHCPMCVAAINDSLRGTDGVVYAKASLKTHQAEVIVPQGFDLNKLLKAIENTGYTGKIEETTPIP